MDNFILEVTELVKYFPIQKGVIFSRQIASVKAVDGVSFKIPRGQTFGLVGESGSGKTTIAKLILFLDQMTSGIIKYDGEVIHSLNREQRKRYSRSVQAVFQDPYSSLNPRMCVRDIIAEPLEIHRKLHKNAIMERVAEVLEIVGLSRSSTQLYPHEFSGGQRQRIAIARALAIAPKLIVLDEPVSALDVSISAQILNLLKEIQRRTGVSFLIIAHNLAMVKHMSDVIGVIYLGRIVELAPRIELFTHPFHPYTRALISAIPKPDPLNREKNEILKGEPPSPISPPSGCHFHPRCPHAVNICKEKNPMLREIVAKHHVACYCVDA